MAKRKHPCLWCGIESRTVTEHMSHIHAEHPETIGRGPTMSREWTCPTCRTTNRPATHLCSGCDHENAIVKAANDGRLFVVWHRLHPTAEAVISGAMSHTGAVAYATLAGFGTALGAVEGVVVDEVAWNPRRLENWWRGRRITWLEVADVTEGTFYHPPARR